MLQITEYNTSVKLGLQK